MIELPITGEQVFRAMNLYDFGELNNSITKGKSNIYGAIGEVVVADYYKKKGFDVSHESTFDYDLKVNGLTVDVKAKHRTNDKPRPNFNVTVADHNTKQKCGFYFFVSVTADFSSAFLLGYIRPDEFYQVATFNKKGESDGPSYKYPCDCWNLPIHQLNKPT